MAGPLAELMALKMFITHDAFRSPLSDLQREESVSYWRAAEVDLCRPWFILCFRESEPRQDVAGDEFSRERTLLFHSASEMARMIRANATAYRRFSAVFAVTPQKVGGHLQWRLKRLRSVLVAEHPIAARGTVELLETVTGALVPTHSLDVPVSALRVIEETFRCPLENGAPGQRPAVGRWAPSHPTCGHYRTRHKATNRRDNKSQGHG